MTKHIINKAEKRVKEKRKHVRKQKEQQNIVAILKDTNGRKNIKLFTSNEEKRHFAKPTAIGWASCPLCGNLQVLVTNSGGLCGSPQFDYLVNHNKKKPVFLCEGSKKKLQDLL